MEVSIVTSKKLCGQNEIYTHYTSGLEELHLTPLHTHDHYEILLMCDGELEHHINGKKTVIKKRTLVFLRPRDVHQLSSTGSQFQYLNITLTDSVMEDLFVYPITGFYRKLLDDPIMPQTFYLSHKEFDEITNGIASIYSVPIAQTEAKKVAIRIAIANIFWDRFQGMTSDTFDNENDAETPPIPQWLWKFQKQLQTPEVFTRDSKYIFSLVDRTRESLSRAYSKYYNTTLKSAILDLRINYACNLLQYTDKEIIDIATLCGFENLSTFYHVFRNKMKYTPKEYRNMNVPSTLKAMRDDDTLPSTNV